MKLLRRPSVEGFVPAFRASLLLAALAMTLAVPAALADTPRSRPSVSREARPPAPERTIAVARSQRSAMCHRNRPFPNLHAVDPAPGRSRSPTVFAPPADLCAHLDAS